MSKSGQKELRLEVRIPKTGYPKIMFFNRFRLERDADFCIVHFGLFGSSGIMQDHYSCLFPRETLQHNQKTLLEYLERIGQPKEKAPAAWQVAVGQTVEVVDIITMAFRADMAETGFFVFSQTAAASVKAGATEVLEAQPLALLRSTPEVQKQFLVALYEE